MIHDKDKLEYKWGAPEDGNAIIIRLSENEEIYQLKRNQVDTYNDTNMLKTHMQSFDSIGINNGQELDNLGTIAPTLEKTIK